ncbi:uncharacterized protein cd34 [Salminus brasiliensis]|uniref:uncharacterized protein cd34 n=1 Tax=Salminus brasiliensis TaxID=930266 RepID=UPI003B830F1D
MATKRMNEMWRRMALALVLCVLLFHSCQGQATDVQVLTDQTNPTIIPDTNAANTDATGASQTKGPETDMTSATQQARSSLATEQAQNSLAHGPTAVSPGGNGNFIVVNSTDEILKFLDFSKDIKKSDPVQTHQLKMIVQCVEKEAVMDRSAVKLELVSPSTCIETSGKLISRQTALCDKQTCSFEIFQEENSNNVIVTGESIEGDVTGMAGKIDSIKADLGVASASPEHRKSSPAVFVSLLVTGLVVAAALIGVYLWRNNCRTNSKGMKLANESVMADEENQGNTLVSVAPLNPPESQEKPSQNGESPEVVKTQNPPAATNGHSATKTADTEL